MKKKCTRKMITAVTLMFSLIFLNLSPARADDSDIFGSNIEPNVMLLIDSSGSMNNEPTSSNSGAYDPSTTYPGSYTSTAVYKASAAVYSLFAQTVEKVKYKNAEDALATDGYWIGKIRGSNESLYLGKYLNYQACAACTSTDTKIDIAKQVVTELIQNVEGVRFGVMTFANNDVEGDGNAKMIAPIGTDKTSMINAVNSITADGWTPTGEQLRDAGLYYEGNFGYSSPIELACQPNFVIIVSDGKQNGSIDVRAQATLGYTEDHSSLTGTQNVIVHTVGFDVSGDEVTNDVLKAAAFNGGGNFFAADDSAQLALALQSAITQILRSIFTFATPVVPTTSASGINRAYVAGFQSDPSNPFWQGFLKAYDRDSNGGIQLLGDGTLDPSYLAWDAGDLLSLKPAADRKIYTNQGSDLKDFKTTTSSISASDLGVSTTAERDQIIDFIRGIDAYDEDGDGNTTEERAWKLGDIFHSTPVLVSPPLMPLSEPSYVAFKNANSGREKVLIVGANDGMLHAFRESDGEELWAFIPESLHPKLKNLADSSREHDFYVDSSPVAADVHVKEGSVKQWKTVVVFGLRRGGGSYTALDITDTTKPKFLWEFTDNKMTESWSEAAIGVLDENNGTPVAFVGAGYDSGENNNSGKAFFVIDMKNGQKHWEYYADGDTDDRQYMNFSIAASATAVDIDSDGFTNRVYIGDIGGQLWKFEHRAGAIKPPKSYNYEFLDKDSVTLEREFTKKLDDGVTQVELKLASDVSGTSPPYGCTPDCYVYLPDGTDPEEFVVDPSEEFAYVGDLDASVYGSGTTLTNMTLSSSNSQSSEWLGKRLFAADPSQANPPEIGEYYPAQAIYGAPALSQDHKGNLWIYFGTGDRYHPRNISSNRFYGIKDNVGMPNGVTNTLTESDLLEVDSSVTSVPDSVQGWFFRLLGSNEKVLAAANVFNDMVFFATFTPDSTVFCGSGGGTAKLYAVGMVTGFAALDFSSGDALASTDGSVLRSKVIGTGIPSKPNVIVDSTGNPSVITGTTSQQISSVPVPPVSMNQLLGWREVF